MTTPAEHCGPACTEAHTYRLGECALSSTPVAPFPPPAAEGLPDGLLASATAGAATLDAAAHDPRTRNLLAHALVQLARDGWIRPAPGAAFDPAHPERQPLPEPEPAPLECVCGTPVDWLFAAHGSGWIHRPGTPTQCGHPRPRCPECQMPHALLPDEPPMCRSIRHHGEHRTPHGHTTSSSNPGMPTEDLLPPGEQAPPGTLHNRLFAVVRYLLGDGPWDTIAWHIADACTAEALRPEQPRPPHAATAQPATGGGFAFTATDGTRLHATPTRRHGQPAVNLRTQPAHGATTAAIDVPADQVEDVIAGLRDIRRQACSGHEPAGVRVTYRASVPRHLLGAAVAEASAAIHAARTGR